MRHLLFIGVFIGFSVLVNADIARQQYLNKDYASAKNSYLLLVNNSPNNYAYNYNLGASFYRLENHLEAKYYFLKALKLRPNSSDAKHNLALVNKQFIDKQFMYENHGRHILFFNIKGIFTLLMMVTGAILCALFFGGIHNKTNRIKRLFSIIMLLLLMLNIIAMLFLISEPKYAMIKPTKLQVYSGPSETQKPLFFAHSGAECEIISASSIWANVQFPNGLKGWVKTESIRQI